MNSNYFSHDSNARNDEKIIRLRMKYKSSGYGIYFMILERMRESKNYMCAKDYNLIGFDLHEDASTIKSIVEDFGLFVFTEDGKYFYSESFLKRMNSREESARKRSEANRNAVMQRWNKDRPAETSGADETKPASSDYQFDGGFGSKDV